MKNLLLSFFVLLSIHAFGQTSITKARVIGAGKPVSIKGIVTNGNELGVIRYIQDDSAGVSVYDTSLSKVQLGDSIQVTGTLTDYNALLEMAKVSSLKILSTGNKLPAPINLSLTNAFVEKYEAMVVQVDNVTFTSGGTFADKTNYKVTDGTTTSPVRTGNATNLAGAPIPAKKVSVVGIMSQYSPSNPATGYQLLLRSKDDVIAGQGPQIQTVLMQTNITNSSFVLHFATGKPGSTIIQYGLTKKLEIGTLSDSNKTLAHAMTLKGLSPTTFYYAQAISINSYGDSSVSGIQYFSTSSLSSGKIKAFFNLSVDTTVAKGVNATRLLRLVDDTLAAYIGKAKYTLDIAIYSFDNAKLSVDISSAINAAYTKGVKVRIISDGSNKNAALSTLNAKIPVLKSPTTQSYGIMHNKFMIIDAASSNPNEPLLWTGSTNWTDNQMFTDANNIIILQDQAIAKAYTLEFNEMWGADSGAPVTSNSKFGPDKSDNTPHLFNLKGKMVEVYFSPGDHAVQHAISTIDSAKKEINFALNILTRTDVANEIKNQIINKSVFAQGVMDTNNGTATYKILSPVMKKNLRVYKGGGIFHHKYFILDATTPTGNPAVITGSHNWSNAAENTNDENVIIVHNDTIANLYYQEWVNRFKENITAVDDEDITTVVAPKLSYFWSQNTLNILNQNQMETQYILMDINGKRIASTTFAVGNITIETGALAKGIYLIIATTPSGIQTYKIIKY
ncbi:MAG: phospholipase D-like domain-containing protein [Bacteroidetes bacterium]|nr:phospholipase D-like domain-containing protein [Bacteroidota bacterium]